MRVILEDEKELLTLNLPKDVGGNYWIKNNKKDNLLNIVAKDNKWVINSNIDVKILKDGTIKSNDLLTNINHADSLELIDFLSFSVCEIETKKVKKVYCLPTYDDTISQYNVDFNKVNEITIGNSSGATINYNSNNIASKQAVISYNNGVFSVKNLNENIPLYVNNILEKEKVLSKGDMVFIDGLMFTIISNILLVNNPNNMVVYDSVKLVKRLLPTNPSKDYSTEYENFVEFYKREEYFQRPPRFKRSIEPKEYKIDPPPGSYNNREQMPLIYTMGPMILMGSTSLVSGLMAFLNIMTGQSTFKQNFSTIMTSLTMMGSMFVFPFLQRRWNKSNIKKKEKKRRKKYKEYIAKKREDILQEIEIQRQILIENNLDLVAVANTILNKTRNLWDRKIEHEDFLNIRLGIGNETPKIRLNIPEEHFSMDEDTLKDVYMELFDATKDIENVPVTINLTDKVLVGMVGNNYSYVKSFLDGFMLQLMANHSYDMLKIVVMTSNEKKSTWEKYRNIPHFWNNDKSLRFIGIDSDNINKLSNYLIQVMNERIDSLNDNDNDNNTKCYCRFKEYYLILCDEVDYIKNTSIFNELIKVRQNFGISMLLITDILDKLPNECNKFINIESNNCGIFETELVSTKQKNFIPDIPNFNLNNCYLMLSNIPVDIEAGKFSLPKTYSFLEMFDVGNVNQLNILNRWKNNNVIQSLSTPVGINEQGELFKIDLHEKAHGPHGLVAGMTGSGKSEWIITYILSMCINYHPDEVQFVLIDYKGGGLAGTFENKETGIKIPHLVGTITNLDISEINRSLASINSELKRRQSLFNSARDKLGESSVDIYKYQKWYREGKIDQPISHLFIISDEFAELKAQQPEFMQELISTARIGRSLGVHLILATQKPSGVVDDQIWSNSKFRVCLKVQDKSDSNDMIKCPDAAMLKETGRFYLQVGFNEFFAKGQSAYAGSPYYESDSHKKTVDTNIEFLNNIGEVYKDINSEKKIVSAVYKGEELPNVLKEIINAGNNSNLHVRKLWLDKISPNIYVNNLLKKYEYVNIPYVLNPVIGEYDAPRYQKQALLTLPLSKGGNTLIYGISGSGKEKLLTTMLYSLSMYNNYKQLNAYILDFGAEVLNVFKKCPIVGEVMNMNDSDRIKNYFKFLLSEFEKRKEIFQDYNGDYYTYITKSKNSIPIILTIINNFENYTELFGDNYLDVLTKLTREAEKYGILFVITCNSVNGINFRLSQNFKQAICLQMKDLYDYKSILGNDVSVIPANIKGRGVMRVLGEAFEFQVADPIESNDLNDYLEDLFKELSANQNGKAPSIKALPQKVDYNFIKDYCNDLREFPIGVETESLEICKYDFLNKYFNIITANDSEIIVPFIKSIVELVSEKRDTLKAIIFDGNKYFNNFKDNVTYLDSFFESSLKNFNNFLDSVSEKTKKTLVIFTGLDNIVSSGDSIESLLSSIFEKIDKIDKMNVVLCDDINSLKNNINDFYINNYISKENALFIGSGIDLQFTLNVKKISMDMRGEIPDNMGYLIKNGKATKIKLIEIIDNE